MLPHQPNIVPNGCHHKTGQPHFYRIFTILKGKYDNWGVFIGCHIFTCMRCSTFSIHELWQYHDARNTFSTCTAPVYHNYLGTLYPLIRSFWDICFWCVVNSKLRQFCLIWPVRFFLSYLFLSHIKWDIFISSERPLLPCHTYKMRHGPMSQNLFWSCLNEFTHCDKKHGSSSRKQQYYIV